jgi:hypothetical protein
MTRRCQLVDMRVAENNRLEHAGTHAVRSIKSVLKTLDKQFEVPSVFHLPTGRSYAALECRSACSLSQF